MRREFLVPVRTAALKRCTDADGIPRCEGTVFAPEPCGSPMGAGDIFYDHDKPDGLGGEPTLENCKVLCGSCHSFKTHKSDNPRMQKADRVRKKHYGVKRPKGIDGRKFDGTPSPARGR